MFPLQISLICLFFSLLSSESVLQNNVTGLFFSSDTTISYGINISKPGCPTKCGNVTVPYPFGIGIGSNCSAGPWFDVYCDVSVDPPYILVSTRDDYLLSDISESQIRIRIPYFASNCINKQQNSDTTDLVLNFSDTPFTLSDANKLTSIGCSDLVVLDGFSKQYPSPNITKNNFASGCVSFCTNGDRSLNGSCPGNGCCQIPVPKGTVLLNASLSGLQDRLGNVRNKPCSYSFLGEQDSFKFQAVSDLYKPPLSIPDWVTSVPVVLDWRIGTENCSVAGKNRTGFGCQGNSVCVDADARVGGYRCRCLDGYEGNPYLPPGCHDIDECKNNPCHPTGICINQLGNYTCGCPIGSYGNGWRDGTGCIQIQMNMNTPNLSKASIGLISVMGFVALLSVSFGLFKFAKKRKTKRQKQKFFKQNGGLLLQQQTSANEGILGKTRIFTSKELERATDRFNESRILGRGGQGTVYKGMLSDGQIVAIKKSQLVDEHKSKEQFINEVVILSQINHRNVVKLLGCCLETKVPLLVYEFVPNGTLSHHIHDGENVEKFPISWNMRVKIASDVAGALAYLHSSTSLPIFHRDIKSSNILLDKKYVAKVSDFGTSKSVAVDQTHLTTNVNGTFGYIDPEYFQSSQLTEKSDVYSFGVVLVELLTGLKPIIPSNSEDDDRSLVSRFLSSMKANNLDVILDRQVAAEGTKEEVLAVATLAKRCLNLNGKKRPNMKEAAMELEAVRMSQMGSNANAMLQIDSSFHKATSVSFSTDDYDLSWTNTTDFGTRSSSDLYPILFDTI